MKVRYMKLEAENGHVIIDVDQAQLVSTLKSLKSYGPSSYACPPFDLLPLEVFAIFKVRQQCGLKSPAVAHPLLSVDVAALENLTFKPDEVSVKVEAAYRNFFG
jgi:hypothetical protein